MSCYPGRNPRVERRLLLLVGAFLVFEQVELSSEEAYALGSGSVYKVYLMFKFDISR